MCIDYLMNLYCINSGFYWTCPTIVLQLNLASAVSVSCMSNKYLILLSCVD